MAGYRVTFTVIYICVIYIYTHTLANGNMTTSKGTKLWKCIQKIMYRHALYFTVFFFLFSFFQSEFCFWRYTCLLLLIMLTKANSTSDPKMKAMQATNHTSLATMYDTVGVVLPVWHDRVMKVRMVLIPGNKGRWFVLIVFSVVHGKEIERQTDWQRDGRMDVWTTDTWKNES